MKRVIIELKKKLFFSAFQLGNNLPMLKFLMEKIGKREIKSVRDKNNRTPLLAAVETGDLSLVKFLISEIGKKDIHGKTPLFVASLQGNLEMVEFLVKIGAKANVTDKIGRNPLFIDVETGHLEVIKFLASIAGKNEINARNTVTDKPILDIAEQNKLLREIIELLQQKMQDVSIQNLKRNNLVFLQKGKLIKMILSGSMIALGCTGLPVSIVNPKSIMSQNNKLLLLSLSISAVILGVIIYLLSNLKCFVGDEMDVNGVTADNHYLETKIENQ